MNQHKAIPEISQDTRVLAARLLQVPPEGAVGYDELSALVNRSLRGRDRHVLWSARRGVERDHGVLFACDRGEGLRRLATSAIPAIGDDALARIGRTSRRASRRMLSGIAAAKDADAATVRSVNARASMLGALELCCKPKNVQRFDTSGPANGMAAAKETIRLLYGEE